MIAPTITINSITDKISNNNINLSNNECNNSKIINKIKDNNNNINNHNHNNAINLNTVDTVMMLFKIRSYWIFI